MLFFEKNKNNIWYLAVILYVINVNLFLVFQNLKSIFKQLAINDY